MAKRVGVDKWLFFTTLMLVVAGLVMVFSASAVVDQEKYHSAYTFIFTQAVWAAIGVLATEKKQDLEKREHEGADDRRRHAKVTCMGVIHTGVKITINKANRQISEELKYCTLTESDGEVKVGPFRGN